ncbi:hypothetical protein H6G41_15360 [Tolypothrix sp. FACHB-123]|uniref:hypothetical protein n=1 Tax=Tolypothrix sp. FACHB-123 TaxID=2692868 RepID=UPI0016844939|nr:hypothetical protein [Tolypothrix sp. FACHB-123]MBD2355983.1 hypothetical protein [Tolypothrix sp. FACHB-123]
MTVKGKLEPPPDTYLSPLLELRDYYARIVEEYERLYTQARSHLNHVEALLSNWSNLATSQKIVSSDVTDETLARQAQEILSLDSISDADSDLLESTNSKSPEPELPDSQNLQPENLSSATTDDGESESASINFPGESSLETKEQSIKGQDFPMLPEYRDCINRIEAIKRVLQAYSGTVCHIDFIVRSLYGDLDPSIFKVVKGRVQSSLTQGKGSSWSAIPDEPGCYTLDLKLLNANNSHASTRTLSQKKKKPIILSKSKIVPMLRAYEGQFLIDAITSLLRQNSGKVFTVAEVIAGLYGELDADELREVKSKVLNELSRGYRTGRFSRVPEKVGLYTWDTNLMRARS